SATDPATVCRAYAIDLDPAAVRPLFDRTLAGLRRTPDIADWPLVGEWDAFADELLALQGAYRDAGSCAQAHPRFAAWPWGLIRRCANEIGAAAGGIIHAVLAFELSAGCTVGCWFCGVSAERFRGHVAYTPANSRRWRGILEAAQDVLGSAVQTGFCYWATDP